MKVFLSGNEAIARGFSESGGRLVSAYPGTPSTEVLESLLGCAGVHAEWAVNEKAALEAAFGGSLSGIRSMACMKHVGLNVASDPLLTASYTGVNAGLLVMVADDPGMFSSQNEQDSRHYARMAKVPCLEPSDPAEAGDFTKAAFLLSERFDTPVMLRTTTRVSHSRGIVEPGEPETAPVFKLRKDAGKYVMLPGHARVRHEFVEERQKRLAAWAEKSPLNRVYKGTSGLGIITHGISYLYAREVFPNASILKLGMTYPLPERMIRSFAAGVDRLAVIEELDPFLEGLIKGMGVRVDYGKNVLPLTGEYSTALLKERIGGGHGPKTASVTGLIDRPPALCPGCAHRGLFVALGRLKAFVSGDIGCYTLGALPPFSALHTTICMGASITGAHGISVGIKAAGGKGKPVAVIGDSTFIHSGITGLVNMVYNGGEAVVVIMNNGTTGMTGGQEHPGTGRNAGGGEAPKLDLTPLCRAAGAGRVREIDAFDLAGLTKILKEETAAPGVSVLISNQLCVLREKGGGRPLVVSKEMCNGCKACLKAGCAALGFSHHAGRGALQGRKGRVQIDRLFCNGCGICAQLCTRRAINLNEKHTVR